MEFIYNPPGTIKRFHNSGAFGRFIVGPLGSAKTFGMIMELFRVAATQAPAPDGKRYTRMAIVRNTLAQLKATTLPDIQQILRPIVNFHVTTSTVQIRAGDIVSDWMLIPLEEMEDQRRLLSTQLTMAAMEEFREINHGLLSAIAGRVGRYPNNLLGGCTRFGVIGVSNPFADGSDWHKFLELDLPSDYAFFRQPSGLSPEAENVENLPPGYYQRLADSHDEAWSRVHIHGENGEDVSGQAVFRASFTPSLHLTKELIPNRQRPLMVGMDFGRTPCALICQVDPQGRLLVFAEETSEDMGLQQFLQTKLKPLMMNERFGGMRHFVIADPAGRIKSQANELTLFDVLQDEGFVALPAPTNDIGQRLRAVEKLFLERRGSSAALLIDEEHCPTLVSALKLHYKYKRKKTGDVNDLPEKSHPWSDVADALQYACLGAHGDAPGQLGRIEARRAAALNRPRVRVSASAWT